MTNIQLSYLDRAISYISPSHGAQRVKSKLTIAALSDSGFVSTGTRKRFVRSMNVGANSPDSDQIEKQSGMIALARDVYMNTPLATSGLDRKTDNTVGSGLHVNSQPDHEFLGISKKDTEKWAKNVERHFRWWAESKDCDYSRQNNFYELQTLTYLSVLLSGDVCALIPYKKLKGMLYGTRVKLIEADLLSTPSEKALDPKVVAGIEFDSDGIPSVYHFSTKYPDGNFNSISLAEYSSIDAYDSEGKKQVHHIMFKKRPGQSRGIGALFVLVDLCKKVTKLGDAELTAHVVSSFFTVFIKDNSGFNQGLGEAYDDTRQVLSDEDPDDQNQYELGPGNIFELNDKKSIEVAQARSLPTSFNDFYISYVRQLSSALKLPYEQLLMHFTASYSASRGALLEGAKAVRVDRAWLVNNFCKPVYESFVDELVYNGVISAPGYDTNPFIRKAYLSASWSGMSNGQLDPKKETEAMLMKINGKLSSFVKEYNSINDDGHWEETMDTLSSNISLLSSLGLLPTEEENTKSKNEINQQEDMQDDDTEDDSDDK